MRLIFGTCVLKQSCRNRFQTVASQYLKYLPCGQPATDALMKGVGWRRRCAPQRADGFVELPVALLAFPVAVLDIATTIQHASTKVLWCLTEAASRIWFLHHDGLAVRALSSVSFPMFLLAGRIAVASTPTWALRHVGVPIRK